MVLTVKATAVAVTSTGNLDVERKNRRDLNKHRKTLRDEEDRHRNKINTMKDVPKPSTEEVLKGDDDFQLPCYRVHRLLSGFVTSKMEQLRRS